jgi:glycosyltransferase involved in cell wall biosynthesis
MHLLFVANFASDTGYAWETIERVFRGAGERLVADGHRVTICYASLGGGVPDRMRGAPFSFAEFDYETVHTRPGLKAFRALIRRLRVDALYLTDRPTWSWRYPLYRLSGVRRLLVHDRTSGERARRGALAHFAKRVLHALPWLSADCCFAVSDFVRRRLVEVNGVPSHRALLVYNGIDLARFALPPAGRLQQALGIPRGSPVVFCSGRAQPYKGVQMLVEAAALLRERGTRAVTFAFCGDGPYLEELRALAERRGVSSFRFLGQRGDVPALLADATVAVVPSLWAEAFGLAVVEAMAAGVPLVATRTGGIPELVGDGLTSLLVEPGDAASLADAIAWLLDDPAAAGEMASRARADVRRRFTIQRSAGALYAAVSSHLRTPPRSAFRPAGRPRKLAGRS